MKEAEKLIIDIQKAAAHHINTNTFIKAVDKSIKNYREEVKNNAKKYVKGIEDADEVYNCLIQRYENNDFSGFAEMVGNIHETLMQGDKSLVDFINQSLSEKNEQSLEELYKAITIHQQLVPDISMPYTLKLKQNQITDLKNSSSDEFRAVIEKEIKAAFNSLGYQMPVGTANLKFEEKSQGDYLKWEISGIELEEMIASQQNKNDKQINNKAKKFIIPGAVQLSFKIIQKDAESCGCQLDKIATSNRFLYEIFSERFSESGWNKRVEAKQQADQSLKELKENKNESASNSVEQQKEISRKIKESQKQIKNISDEVANFLHYKVKFSEAEQAFYAAIVGVNQYAEKSGPSDTTKELVKNLTNKVQIETKQLLGKVNPPSPKQVQAWQKKCEIEINRVKQQLAVELGFDGVLSKLKLAIMRFADAFMLFIPKSEHEGEKIWQTKLHFFDKTSFLQEGLQGKIKLLAKHQASSAIVKRELDAPAAQQPAHANRSR